MSTNWVMGETDVTTGAVTTKVTQVSLSIVVLVATGHSHSTSTTVDPTAEEAFVSASGSTDEEREI